MQYDVDKLQGAYKSMKRFQGYTLTQLANETQMSVACVSHVLKVGRGRHDTMEKVARALGFNGRKDVTIAIKKRA